MGESISRLRHPPSRNGFLGVCLVIVALIPMTPVGGDAQIVTDISSSGLNTQVNITGTSYDITGGTRPGSGPNLFHSFGNFNVGAGDTANFLNDLGLATSNILGRVTGGNISQIYGTLQTTDFGNANLFLLNPTGIVLGPGASLNVGGSVSFTTVQYFRLFDGVGSVNFYANPVNDGLPDSILAINSSAFEFLSASPAGYGFLTTPAPTVSITVQGSNLAVPSGQSISLIGGKVVVEGGAQVSASSGSIYLASAASPGEFDLATLGALPNRDGVSFASSGSVSLAPASSIDVHGSSTVFIRGGQLALSMNEATLSTSEAPAPPDTIALGPGSSIQTTTIGTDPGADVQLTSGTIRMDGANITTVTVGLGSGGALQLQADSLTVENGASIVTATVDGGGVGGDVVLNVGTATLTGGSSIQSQTQNVTPGFGQGGHVSIQGLPGAESGAATSVALSEGSSLLSSSFGAGEGGRVTILSTSLTLDGADTSVKAEAADVGRGGDIVIGIRQAGFSGGATIRTITGSADPNAPAAATVTVQGLSGTGSLADAVSLSGTDSGIVSDTIGTARSGDVSVHAKVITLRDGAVIQTGTSVNTGAGGNVTVDAETLTISSEARIASLSAAGDAGQVAITADQLTMNNVSIESSTSSSGRGGDVVIDAEVVRLSNGATINSSTSEAGRAGDIAVHAPSITLRNGATISSSSTGAGNAGNISINSKASPGTSVLMEHSTINTSAALADGGNIEIYATDMIRLTDSLIISSVGNPTKTDTLGGNITIDPDFVILKGSEIRANAFAGDGGNIGITAGLFLADAFSQQNISASSEQGVSGTVQINAPINNLSSVVGRLPESLVEVQALLRAACAARLAQGQTSSFVERGRDSIPAGPEGLLASPFLPMTSGHLSRLPVTPSREPSNIQVRRRSGNESPAPAIIFSEHAACSS
ncbi:MAG: filamentous hemagglutinin N-terminal domain-containing protein [Nitrospira sp.]|nr:filamentous hemagglutinin N-terminal domain-containing protein [Nitrospira sp.]MBH0180579.1 filamentous hemagglutinin N-terminal domain-containing protein [Nitrospira sp.]MBH0186806.1 filamentous hemagglutinin N-terminal domain-containing protein [Nitrospira sp.]